MFKDYVRGIVGTATPAGGFALSFEQALSPWLRLAALLIGIATGCMMFLALRESNRQKKLLNDLRIANQEAELCQQCRIGKPPAKCPLPPNMRPKDCPHGDLETEDDSTL
jgi:hypothetical protein